MVGLDEIEFDNSSLGQLRGRTLHHSAEQVKNGWTYACIRASEIRTAQATAHLPSACRQEQGFAINLQHIHKMQSTTAGVRGWRLLAVILIMTKSSGTVLLHGRSPARPALNLLRLSLYAISRISSSLWMCFKCHKPVVQLGLRELKGTGDD